jgi:hypothetical protein
MTHRQNWTAPRIELAALAALARAQSFDTVAPLDDGSTKTSSGPATP